MTGSDCVATRLAGARGSAADRGSRHRRSRIHFPGRVRRSGREGVMQAYEKLGAFYLGREYDREAGRPRDGLVLYDAKDLTTHAVCVGMTGSGKTGMCVTLLEEALIDGIPALAIDPKGDLGSLLLTFPDLRPEDFRPWVDEGEAARKGQTPDEYARSVAQLWGRGLADWGQDGDRIRRHVPDGGADHRARASLGRGRPRRDRRAHERQRSDNE